MKSFTASAHIVAGIAFALLAGCASDTPTKDVASADTQQPKCQKTEATTGSFISRTNCSKDAGVTEVDAKNVMDQMNAHRGASATH